VQNLVMERRQVFIKISKQSSIIASRRLFLCAACT
jgi:hypothetical protein